MEDEVVRAVQGPPFKGIDKRGHLSGGVDPDDSVDSLALVELMDGQADAAQANSANVVVDDPSGVHLFHLAQGQLLTGNRQAARESLQNAIKVGLTPASLHPLEVARFEELRAQLEPSHG